MPTLHNPAAYRLACYRIGRILDADERVEITDDEAADLANGTVFVVEGYGEHAETEQAAAEPEPSESDDEDEADADEQASATPRRTTARRGGKRAEVTEAPETETRG